MAAPQLTINPIDIGESLFGQVLCRGGPKALIWTGTLRKTPLIDDQSDRHWGILLYRGVAGCKGGESPGAGGLG
jgi:hypothetical protein